MSERNFMEMLRAQWADEKFVCVGLDSEVEKLPECMPNQLMFNVDIVSATVDLVCCYKPNIAFYEGEGDSGLRDLRETIFYIKSVNPRVPVILDAKRADIGNTNRGYVEMAFEYLGADAITVHPYLGGEALQPFLGMKDKGIFVLCRTSNPGAGEFQDLLSVRGESLYRFVALRVANKWSKNGNCALVVGATYPDELQEVRELVGDTPILVPGVGAQGGDVEKTVKAGMDANGQGMIINSSRGIIFASSGDDFAKAARRETEKLHNLINQFRKGGE